MIRFLRVAYSIPHFPFLCNSISKLSLPLIPTFWGKKRRGTLERVPRTPQNFHKYALTRVLLVMFKWLRPEGITSAARVQPRGCKGRSLPASQHRPGLAAGGAGGASPPIEPVLRGFNPGDARGGAPCIRKPKISPFPPGRGAGGMGVKKHCRGRKSQCRAGLAAGTPGAPAPGKINQKSPPSPRGKGVGGMGAKSTDTAEKANAVRVQPRGCKGLRPLHKKTKNLPLPHEGRGQGDGGKKH